ncbi:MAG: hypothetical protein J6S67_26155 [Methanobrevibacter sp.]|nr:hypothetical protein [Methanobrevibacter sp.]
MKTYRFEIVIPHTRYEEVIWSNSVNAAEKAYTLGYLVIDHKTGEEYIGHKEPRRFFGY